LFLEWQQSSKEFDCLIEGEQEKDPFDNGIESQRSSPSEDIYPRPNDNLGRAIAKEIDEHQSTLGEVHEVL